MLKKSRRRSKKEKRQSTSKKFQKQLDGTDPQKKESMNRFRSEDSIKERKEREQAGREAAQKAIAEGKSLKEVQQAQKDAEKSRS